MRKILRVEAETTVEEIQRFAGATSVELVAGGTVAIVEIPDDAVGGVAKQVADPSSPILSSEDDPEVSCEAAGDYERGVVELESWSHGYRSGWQDAQRSAVDVVTAESYSDTDEATWGLTAIGRRGEDVELGQGIRVCVLDTGLAREHSAFAGREIVGRNFTTDDPDDWEDRFGHGSHCAGTVCGRHKLGTRRFSVAPLAELMVGKVLADNGRGRMSDVMRGISWAVEQGASVVSMSLGGNGRYAYLDTLGRWATERGVLLVAAAGNDGKQKFVHAPANSAWIMAVGALNRSLRSSVYSSAAGPDPESAVDVSAPGSGVWSAWWKGGFTTLSGTSMAAPHCAGAAACWLRKLGLKGQPHGAAMTWMQVLANARSLPERASWVGSGIVQVP